MTRDLSLAGLFARAADGAGLPVYAPVAGQRLGVRAGALRRAGGNDRCWDLAASDHVAMLELDLE
jgi:hypothetical protein